MAGTIHNDVSQFHLSDHPTDRGILQPFLSDFDVTWGRRIETRGSAFSIFILKPLPHITRAFGFENEIPLLYSSYAKLEPRAMLALEDFATSGAGRGRVDTMICFLATDDINHAQWSVNYSNTHRDRLFPIIASFSAQELRDGQSENLLIRNLLAAQLHQLDLFDDRQPIRNDHWFIGRTDLASALVNAYQQSNNFAIFGLRKTGKTSLFFKLQRLIQKSTKDICLYRDCKAPHIRNSTWQEVLRDITHEISRGQKRTSVATEQPSQAFESAVRRLGKRKVVIIFDEIEYITPRNVRDVHWQTGFIDFWQSIVSVQAQVENLSILMGGVNPWCVETPSVDGIQNPLFGLVSYEYLAGMTVEEIRHLLRTYGRPMGLRFPFDTASYIHNRYGGHPLITRLACSEMHKVVKSRHGKRPLEITVEFLEQTERLRETRISLYVRYLIDDLRRFYPDEYELISEVALGNIVDMWEFATNLTFTEHLRGYGLLNVPDGGRPTVSIPALIPVLSLYDRTGQLRSQTDEAMPIDDRSQWLRERKSMIHGKLDLLERQIQQIGNSLPPLYGPVGYPNANEFHNLRLVENRDDFKLFIDVCHKCFVEAIRAYGKTIESKPNEHFNNVRETYPELGKALDRIRVYRANEYHLLSAQTDRLREELLQFLKEDLGGKNIEDAPDGPFRLQWRVLDELLAGILAAIDQLS